MMSGFFINRPIFAWVIAIIMMLAGGLAIQSMSIAQFPAIAPPAISITAVYPGADAQTLENSTTQILEQQMKGLDHLRYFSSTSDASGTATITLTFDQGTDPDTAQVQVQNKVQLATPLLPQEVQLQGVRVAKSVRNFALVVAFYSQNGSHDQDDIGDYVASKIQDPLTRVTGVGDVQSFGSQYAMRIWLDPFKMQSLKITTSDVTNAISAQNAQVSAGQIGGLPTLKGQSLNAVITAQSRLQTANQFRAIVLKSNIDGSAVRLGDVARVAIGAESANSLNTFNGKPASGIAIKLAPGANALTTVKAVKAEIDRLSGQFPPDIKVGYPLDSTPFVSLSIKEVVTTLIEAIILVFLVMLVFLQNWRATLIPTIAVPVVLLGSFAVLYMLGFTINTLTLFGIVLAIGLLVDDAIVVVENVERLIADEGLSPKDAARRSMEEVSSALIGIGLVLAAVFLPMAFFSGSAGVIYRQFSITIVAAMALSVIVALTLTPALCAALLKPKEKTEERGFFGWFNRKFAWARDGYMTSISAGQRRWGRTMIFYGVIILAMVFLFLRLPGGFLPEEDQGQLFAQVVLPAGSTIEETEAAMAAVRHHFLVDEKKNVVGMFTVSGFSFGGTGQNVGLAFIRLADWKDRTGSDQSALSIANRATMQMAPLVPKARFIAFSPPAVLELGNATGFDYELVNKSDASHAAMVGARNQLLGMASTEKEISQFRPNGLDDAPQLRVDVDTEKASALGLSQSDVSNTLSTAMGGTFVNNFLDRGRIKKVFVQADAPFRTRPEDLDSLYVRGTTSNVMTPLSAFASTRWSSGPSQLERYNGQPSFELLGAPAPGFSTGNAMKAMETLSKRLPAGFDFEWTGLSYEELQSSGQAIPLYGISLLVIFLCLAALYESWAVPIAVIMVVPLGVIGAVVAANLTGLDNDIYFQVGLITTIGISAKNAILIVEFAEERMIGGMSAIKAAFDAAKLRLRPILMTSFAFIFGVLPLALSSGAGAAGRHAIGRSVVGGMLSGTLVAIFFVPIFFVLVKKLFRQDQPDHAQPDEAAPPAPAQEA